MKKYIFGQRSGIYIIDLEKTEECINHARDFLLELSGKGEFVLFVGTKKQAQEAVEAVFAVGGPELGRRNDFIRQLKARCAAEWSPPPPVKWV